MSLETLTDEQEYTLKVNYNRWKKKEITAVALMEMLELKKNIFYKIIKEYEER